jgi:hypothetical protein
MNPLQAAWFHWRRRRNLRYIQREHRLLRQRLHQLGARVEKLGR